MGTILDQLMLLTYLWFLHTFQLKSLLHVSKFFLKKKLIVRTIQYETTQQLKTILTLLLLLVP